MGKCPICEKDYQEGMVCPQCGFDSSRDYERYPTVFAVSGGKSVQALREEWKRKQEPERAETEQPPFVPRKGENLFCVAVISAEQAAQGCQTVVGGYMGKKVSVTIPAQCANGKQLRCRGLGYPSLSGGERGDLYVTVQVETEADEPEPESAPEPAPPVTEHVPQADSAKKPVEDKSSSRKIAEYGCVYIAWCGVNFFLSTIYGVTDNVLISLTIGVIGGLVGLGIIWPFRLMCDSFEKPNQAALDICLGAFILALVARGIEVCFRNEVIELFHLNNSADLIPFIPSGILLLGGLIARMVFGSKKKREQQ